MGNSISAIEKSYACMINNGCIDKRHEECLVTMYAMYKPIDSVTAMESKQFKRFKNCEQFGLFSMIFILPLNMIHFFKNRTHEFTPTLKFMNIVCISVFGISLYAKFQAENIARLVNAETLNESRRQLTEFSKKNK